MDLIDREKLISDLEGIKISFPDIFLSSVLNCAIDCVKNQPAVKGGEDHE